MKSIKMTQFKKSQKNLTISRSAIIYHFSSTMAYENGRARKLGKQNRKQLDRATDPSSAPSTPLYSYDKLNENSDITSKKALTEETHYRTIFALGNKPSGIVQNKSASNPYSKDMLISNISVDNNA